MVEFPASARCWRVNGRLIACDDEPIVFGVLNVTPDSFYDGGRYDDPAAAVSRGFALADAGAAFIDCGAESTRPGAEDVPDEEQLRRLEPVVRALAAEGLLVSVDTRSAVVADRLLAAGAVVVNDVSGGADPAMFPTVAAHDAAYVLMHARGTPRTMQVAPRYDDVVAEVRSELAARLEAAVRSGVRADAIVVDPGIGFGKRPQDNLDLVAGLSDLLALGRPLLVGLSRKSFLGVIGAGKEPASRLAGSLGASVVAWQRGARIFRTHDPRETLDAIAAARAIAARDERAREDGSPADAGEVAVAACR